MIQPAPNKKGPTVCLAGPFGDETDTLSPLGAGRGQCPHLPQPARAA